jgi:ubiquinol-cytochrome c reductase subunit 9
MSSQQFYNTLFKRNSVFVPTIFLTALGFSIGFDLATSAWWDAHNKGVSVDVARRLERSET